MSQRKNGLPQGFKPNSLHSLQTGKSQPHQPAIMPPQTATALQLKKPSLLPAAPSVYRPQPAPKVLQTKSAGQRQPVHQPRPVPAAPSAYRPQPAPNVLQSMTASGLRSQAVNPPRQPVAPPVYRPEQKRIVQPKMATAAQPPATPKAPPVYRPQSTPQVLQAKTPQTKAGTHGQHNRTTPPQAQQLTRHEPARVSQSQPARTVAAPTPPTIQRSTQVVQRKKVHAEQYNTDNKLGLKVVSFQTVTDYVNNKGNPKDHRLNLMNKWNRGHPAKGVYRIPIPDDLTAKEVPIFKDAPDLTNYDSDDDDRMDLKATIEKNKLRRVTLERGKNKIEDVAVLDLPTGLKVMRQVVKRDEYYEHLPVVVELGGQQLEFATPYGNDVYCYGLKKTGNGYQRSGGNREFNYVNLATNLDATATTPESRKRKREVIFGPFKGQMLDKYQPEEAEAIGAIGCDFLKGMGNMHYVNKAEKLGGKDDLTFKEMFTGANPVYRPAMDKGRKLATQKTAKLKRQEGYQPTDAQTNYLNGRGRRLRWVRPDGLCVFGSLAHVAKTTTSAAIERTKEAIQRADANVTAIIISASEQLGQSQAKTTIEIWRAITTANWANPRVGDYIIHIAAAALNIGVTIVHPDASLTPINGGGELIVRVTQPLEHYHATKV